MSICLQKVELDNHTVQLFEDEQTGHVTGYRFTNGGKYYQDPLDLLPHGFKPVRMSKTQEEIEEELKEIKSYPAKGVVSRGLKEYAIKRFNIKTGLSEVDGETITTMHFPYTKDGSTIGYKCKLMEPKRFWSAGSTKDADLFGWEQAIETGSPKLFITEGECFTPDTEVLTPEGWITLADYTDQVVMQVNYNQRGSFTIPSAVVSKHYEGNLIEYQSGSYRSLTTPKHNLIRLHEGKLIKRSATQSTYLPVPRVILGKEDDLIEYNISDTVIQSLIMFSADFTIRRGGDIYGVFKKKRKIARAKSILNALKVRYSSKVEASGYTNFYIHRKQKVLFFKTLPHELLSRLSTRQLHVMQKELVYWDGNKVNKRNQEEYSTKIESNAIFVQTLCHLLGYTSTIIERSNSFGSWLKVSMLYGKQTSSTQNGYKKITYKGEVKCLTVDTGMLLVRYKGSISVSGNCDTIALYQMLKDKARGSQWADLEPAVVSVPNGAGAAKSAIVKKLSEIHKHFKDVVLVFDMDESGKAATKDVVQILPEATVASLPFKDANECLMKGRQKAFCNAVLFKANKPKNTRLIRGSTLREAARKKPEWGLSYPWDGLTDLTRGVRRGETLYFGAGVKMGKSELVNALAEHIIVEHDSPVLLIKPEEAVVKSYQMLVSKAAGKIFHDPKIEFDEEAFDKYEPLIGDKAIIIDSYQFINWDTLKGDIRYAVTNEGVKDIFIDPITALTNQVGTSEANEFLVSMTAELSAMAKDLDFTADIFCHLKAPTQGEPHERGGSVLSTQFAGSRAMMRSCNYMIGLEGNKAPELEVEEKNMRKLVVLEDREFGNTGVVPLYWDLNTALFNEVKL